MFEANKYIERIDANLVLCSNPVADGGISAMTVNLNINNENMNNFRESVQRMVLSKLLSPKFAEVILAATQMRPSNLALNIA